EAEGLGEADRAERLLGAVGTAVHLEDVVVEALDPEAEPGHANLAEGLELFLRERPRFGLEGDFLGLVPREQVLHPARQALELRHGEVAGRAAAEIDELRLAPREIGRAGVAFELADARI